MRVLMLSMDVRVNEQRTPTAERLAALAKQAGEIVALTPDGQGSKPMQFVRLWRRAASSLQQGTPFDLITIQDTSYLALLALILARRARVPLEVQVHGFERMRGVRKILAWFVLQRADRVRVVSERLRQNILSNFQIPASNVYVLPVYAQIAASSRSFGETPDVFRQSVPTHASEPLTSGVGNRQTSRTSFTFLTVGRLVPVKNIALQIHAFARIAKEFPQTRLCIVGSGPELSYLQLLTTNYQLQTRISFEGYQTDTAHFYQSADAFLLSSDSEGWGVAVVEVAAYGLPIIMTDVGLAGEFIRDSENGIVIPVRSEIALAVAMKRIIMNAELRARLGRAARASFLALPSKDGYIQRQITEWRSAIMH